MAKKKVSKERYEKFINSLELKDLKLVELHVKLEEWFKPPAEIKIEEKARYEKEEEKEFRVFQEYRLQGLKDGKAGMEIDAVYLVSYASEVPIDDGIFKIFSTTGLLLHTWPYFRELVNSMTLRMHLPPLVLDVVRVR